MILESKQIYYNSKITEANGNQKELFCVIDKILKPQPEPQLPSHDDASELADRFATFFISKIEDIRKSLATINLGTNASQQDHLVNIPVKLTDGVSIEQLSEYAWKN